MYVPVSILFSYNEHSFGSKLISFFTAPFLRGIPFKIVPSHVAILIANKWVFEATSNKGVIITPFSKWQEKNILIYSHFIGQVDYSEIKKHVRSLEGCSYDWLGLCYCACFILLHFLLRTPVPSKNLLESEKAFFCTELLGKILDKDFSMQSPAQILAYCFTYGCFRDK